MLIFILNIKVTGTWNMVSAYLHIEYRGGYWNMEHDKCLSAY